MDRAQGPSGLCRMYNTYTRRAPVWQRLVADARVRHSVPRHQYSFWAGHGPGNKEEVGYKQCVVEREVTVPPPGSEMIDPPASKLHRLALERYRKHFPTEFYTAIRPHTSTMNQTLRCMRIMYSNMFFHITCLNIYYTWCCCRMLGTYATDVEFADRYNRNLHTSQYPARPQV